MTAFLIPLTNQNQTLGVSLAGVTYNLRVIWNDANQAWTLDIYDSSNNPIVTGIPIITGADLLEQYGYLGIGGQLIAQTNDNADAVPTYQNLGQTGNLYFVTNP